jgi:hypothetical protein
MWFGPKHLIYTVKYLIGEDKFAHAKIYRSAPVGDYDEDEELTLV